MDRHPTCDAFSHFQTKIADFRIVRQLRCAQNHFAAGMIGKIHQARVAIGHLHDQSDQFIQHRLAVPG